MIIALAFACYSHLFEAFSFPSILYKSSKKQHFGATMLTNGIYKRNGQEWDKLSFASLHWKYYVCPAPEEMHLIYTRSL